jgi:hypothetical protein
MKMDEQRLERMEEMLTNLITIVGNGNQLQKEMKREQQEMKKELIEMKEEQSIMRIENEKQFSEIHKKLSDIQLDQDHIWEKVVRNERELAKIKGHLQV